MYRIRVTYRWGLIEKIISGKTVGEAVQKFIDELSRAGYPNWLGIYLINEGVKL